MKKLVLFALSVVATAAMAVQPTPANDITINGHSAQIAVLSSSGVDNTATGAKSLAQQNLASNAGDVTVNGHSLQIVGARDSWVGNTSNANTVAQQNLSSNIGDVTVNGHSLQVTLMDNSSVTNSATGRDASAVQNVASNNACFACTTTRTGSHHGNH